MNMEKKTTYPFERSLEVAKKTTWLDLQRVLSEANSIFQDPKNREKVIKSLTEVFKKLSNAPFWIQWYSDESIQQLLRTAFAVVSTSKSIATVWVLTDRWSSVSA